MTRARPSAMADASSAYKLDPISGKVAHAVPIAWTPAEVNTQARWILEPDFDGIKSGRLTFLFYRALLSKNRFAPPGQARRHAFPDAL